MPTYEQALAANPAAFTDYAAEMAAAATDLTEHRAEYDSTVVAINAGWEDEANAAFNDDAVVVDEHVEEVVEQVGGAAEMLKAGGTAMESMVKQLQALDASYRGAGFTVQPAPKVELGAVHWAAIAAAGPFGPMLQALFQARADEGTMQLQLGLTVLTATDTAVGAGLTGAAEQFEPLTDKGSGLERTDRRTDVAADDTGQDGEDGRGTEDTADEDPKGGKKKGGPEDAEKQQQGKDEDEDKGEDDDRDEQQDQGPESEQEDPQQDPEQSGPETPGAGPADGPPEIPGYEPPGPVDHTLPDTGPADLPDFESDWDPAELGEPADLPSGGLAGGGGGIGGGAGPGSPDL
ncbi:WXG100 family type VII secretion target, partial [Glycomyces endophyticus]|uniref:WXG100 family type VII secretion target n=1 Tax=Glycomyces endophyticus TaxID=480996 RepID=UPI0031D7273A